MLLDTCHVAIRGAHADEALYFAKSIDAPQCQVERVAASRGESRLVELSAGTARALEWYWPTLHFATVAEAIRTTEIRSSDYIEANSIFTVVLTKPLQSGARVYVPALDQPHSWTSIVDVGHNAGYRCHR
jgi:hypothetical protein